MHKLMSGGYENMIYNSDERAFMTYYFLFFKAYLNNLVFFEEEMFCNLFMEI